MDVDCFTIGVCGVVGLSKARRDEAGDGIAWFKEEEAVKEGGRRMNRAVVESAKGWKVDHSVTCNRTNMLCKHKDIVRCQNERWVVYFKNEDV